MNRETDPPGGRLESRYRGILRLLPATYREQRAEEMLSTLLEGAGAGKRWPDLGEVASLAAFALRLRVGAPGGSRRAEAAGEVLRRTALSGLLAFGLWYAAMGVSNLVDLLSSSSLSYARYIARSTSAWWWTLGFVQPWVYLGALTALILGRRRVGRLLAVAQVTLVAVQVAGYQAVAGSDRAALLAASLMITAAAGLGFHREAAPLPSPRRRLAVAAGLTGFVIVIAAVSSSVQFDVGSEYSGVIEAVTRMVAGPLLPALAMLFGVLQARKSPIWPAALLLLGLPGLLLVPRVVLLYVQGKGENTFVGDLFAGAPWPGMAAFMLIADTVLAVALGWALYRRRRAHCAAVAG